MPLKPDVRVNLDLSRTTFWSWLFPRRHKPIRPRYVSLRLECLEERTLLAASIFGNVFNDLVGDGLHQQLDPPLASQVAYLDLNNNNRFDSVVTPFAVNSGSSGTSLPIDTAPGELGTFGFFTSPLAVQGVADRPIKNISVTMDLTNNSNDAIQIALLSPLDIDVPQVPVLFTIAAHSTFAGTFDGNSTNPILLYPVPLPSGYNGTYAPQMPFSNPQLFLYNGDPNGEWGLAFAPPNPADLAQVELRSWSIKFTQAEPSATTDSAGNYSFTNLASGTYHVGLVHATADSVTSAGGAVQTVNLASGQTATGVDFGVHANPDLTGVYFAVSSSASAWGQPITVDYTLTNRGVGDATAFDVGLYLSQNGVIVPSAPLRIATIHFDGLAAGKSASGSVTALLPASSPFGATAPGTAYVGLIIDPAGSLTESVANQSNQGAGIDLAPLAMAANTAVSSEGVQQAPSVAVDPKNANHIATAYMDYSLLTTGYAGIRVAVSSNGGASWTYSTIPLPAGYDQGASDPTAVFDNSGHLFVSFMAATFLGTKPNLTSADSNQRIFGFQSNNGIFVARSNDGGLNWHAPVPVETNVYTGTAVPFDTYPNMAIDTGTTLPDGSNPLYVTWTRYYPAGQFPGDPSSTNGSDVMIAVSNNGGADWATSLQYVPSPPLANQDYGFVVTAPNEHITIDTSGGYSGKLKVRVLNGSATALVAGNQFLTSGSFATFDLSAVPVGDTVYVRVSGDPSNPLTGGDTATYELKLLDGATVVDSGTDSRVVPTGPGTGLVSAIKDPHAGTLDQGAAGTGTVGLSNVTVGGGAVYVSTYTGGYFTVYVSFDGGQSFYAPDFLTYQQNPFNYVSTQVKTDPTLGSDQFRTLPVHLIAADPIRPGVLYAVGANSADQLAAGAVAASGIVFAVSYDYGQSWTTNFTVGTNPAPLEIPAEQVAKGFYPVLNDDNGGQYPPFADSPQSQVISYQAMPSISVDAQGRIVVIWYDTRGDLSGQKLGVWGTISTDGGQHFSPNFQITSTNFDPNAAAFTDANGNSNFYLGDHIGVAAANGAFYAVWTDARTGTQHIQFAASLLTPIPAAPADRFSPNSTLATATPFGTITVQQSVPQLVLPPGSPNEWFAFQAGASHVSISVSADSGGSKLALQLTDANGVPVEGAVVTPVLNAAGTNIGAAIAAPSSPGTTYFIHVSAQTDAAIKYTLTLGSLTADLGTRVEGNISDTVDLGGQNVYRVAVAVTGTLVVNFSSPESAGSGLNVKVLAGDGRNVLTGSLAPVTTYDANATFSLPVIAGQVLLFQISAVDGDSSGDFQLHFTDLDQYQGSTDHGTHATGSISDGQVVPVPQLGNADYGLQTLLGGNVEVVVTTGGGYAGYLNVRVLDPVAGYYFVPGGFPQHLESGDTWTFPLGNLDPEAIAYVRISGVGFNPGDEANYSIQLINLDHASVVEDGGTDSRSVPSIADIGPQNLANRDYTVTPAVSGTLNITMNTSGGYAGALKVRVLNTSKTALLPGGGNQFVESGDTAHFSVPVTAGQPIYIRVSGLELNLGDEADYTFQLDNLDEAATLGISTLFFATVGDPTSIAAADLGNGHVDLLVGNTDTTDSLGILRGTGNGTFWSEAQYAVGPGLNTTLGANDRQIAVANLNGDAVPDVVVPNFRSADISVLIGNGDGTVQPQRRFDAVTNVNSIVTGKFTPYGNTDVIALENFAGGAAVSLAYLKGYGDGTFAPPVFYETVFKNGAGPIVVGDFNGDNNLDVVVFSKNVAVGEIFIGVGNGTFLPGRVFTTGEAVAAAATADLNGDHIADIVTTGTNSGSVYVMFGNGDGTFQTPVAYHALPPRAGDNVTVPGLALVDWSGSGHLDIIVSAQSRSGQGAASVLWLPGDGLGNFGNPQVLAHTTIAGTIVAGDFGNGATDLAITDKGGVTVVYGSALSIPANNTSAAARKLGNAEHLVTLPEAIVSTHQDAYFSYLVPVDPAPGSGDQVVDISAPFSNTASGGLTLEVTGAVRILQKYSDAGGAHWRVLAQQGSTLSIHVGGLSGGVGVYSLDIDVLPQIVSVQAQAAFPGAPPTSLVITLQGDNLDPLLANDPANYTVYRTGADGVTPIGSPISIGTVLYNQGAAIQVEHDRTFPTAVRQTVTLSFVTALDPTATYMVTLSSKLQTAKVIADETAPLIGGTAFLEHPIVSVSAGPLKNGASVAVKPIVDSGSLDQLHNGTAFLSQLHDDLGAQLDSLLKLLGDSPLISTALTNEILARFLPGYVASGSTTPFLIIWLDPVSIQLADPNGTRQAFNQQTNTVTNGINHSFLEVGGNVQVMVVAAVTGLYQLNISDVASGSRGGAIVFNGPQVQTVAMTEAMRQGTQEFNFEFLQSDSGEVSGGTGGITSSPSGVGSPAFLSVFFKGFNNGTEFVSLLNETNSTENDSAQASDSPSPSTFSPIVVAAQSSASASSGNSLFLVRAAERLTEILTEEGGVQTFAGSVMEFMRSAPALRLLRNLLGIPVPPQQEEEEEEQDPSCGVPIGSVPAQPTQPAQPAEMPAAPSAEPVTPRNDEATLSSIDLLPAAASPVMEANPTEPVRNVSTMRRLQGLFVTGILAVGATIGLAFAPREEERRSVGLRQRSGDAG